MIDITLIIFFIVMAFKIVKVVKQETAIFQEFNQSQSFGWFSLLFPLGPIVYLTTVYRLGWLPAIILTVLCFLPALITAKKSISAFERAGTDRVRKAHNAATQAFGTAIAGLVYSAVILLGVIFVNNSFA